MRILVTGSSGQVGSALMAALAPLGTVLATGRSNFDLATPRTLLGQLDDLTPDIIINPAAYTAVDQAEDERELAMRVNAEAPRVMAQWAASHAVPLIHFSTDYVFGGAGDRAWREDDATAPLSAYGSSKLAGEREVLAAGGCPLIVRTSWVYAAKGKNFLRTIARLAREREELRIVSDQVGAPTSARRLADVVALMLAAGIDDLRIRTTRARGLVHVCAAGEASWYQFASAIIDGLKCRGVKLAVTRVVPIRSDDYPTPAKRPRNSRLDLGRLHELFGIRTPHWEQDLMPELDQLAQEISGRVT
jgi:dTDP-4-dehydrorhamnose reductase